MPVNCIFLVKFNSRCEVRYSFIILEEAIPDKTTPIIGGSILRIQFDDLVEVLKRLVKTVTSDFLAYCAEMVYRLNVARL